jgi:hypothetical protein
LLMFRSIYFYFYMYIYIRISLYYTIFIISQFIFILSMCEIKRRMSELDITLFLKIYQYFLNY